MKDDQETKAPEPEIEATASDPGSEEAPGEDAGSDAPDAETAERGEPSPGGVPLEPDVSAVRRLEDQLSESQERWLRLAAEFDNFRKRIAKERVELGDRAQAALVMRLLEVLDDLDRLAEQDVAATDRDVLHQALVLVDRKLRKELEAAGLERIDPVGEPFDPTLHEAVSVLPPPTAAQEDQVSALFRN